MFLSMRIQAINSNFKLLFCFTFRFSLPRAFGQSFELYLCGFGLKYNKSLVEGSCEKV